MKLIIDISEGIYKHKDTIQNGSIGAKQILNAVKDGIPAYKTIPSAEPQIGHWVLGLCDNCGYDWNKDAPIASVPNFCPNCGFRML